MPQLQRNRRNLLAFDGPTKLRRGEELDVQSAALLSAAAGKSANQPALQQGDPNSEGSTTWVRSRRVIWVFAASCLFVFLSSGQC